MSFFRSVIAASLVSLIAAMALHFIGFSMGFEEFRGGYAVLSVDEDAIEDKPLKSIIQSTGLYFVGEPVCESTQWVFLDGFDSILRIPLDEYGTRVFDFDPRNDGYADKVREIFVRNGKRYAYIPLMAGNWNSDALDKKLAELMRDIPFSVNYFGIGRPLFLFFAVYTTASALLLIFIYRNRKVHRSIVNIIPMIPVLSSLGFFGAAGIGSAALLYGLFILLKEPLGDLVNPTRPHSKYFKKRMAEMYKEIILPYKNYWFFLPVFVLAFAVLVIFSQLQFLFLIAASVVSFAVFFFSLKIVSFSGVEHKRFNPITIVKRRFPEFVFPIYILPFIVGAFVTMIFTPRMSGSYDNSNRFDIIIEEKDYFDHIEFQTSFSVRRFGADSDVFPVFYPDSDGFPVMNANAASAEIRPGDYPPFPLKYLMEFFNTVNSGTRTTTDSRALGGIGDNLSLLVLLLFVLPGLIINNKLLYNKKNMRGSRKDA
ncbi:MAG: hypothetical protein FWC01_01205 [Treponema sp.]|nr:hypothetical protein [Treponema sp.]MCL2236770.1 hypothetical protein [Treponema sp.]